MSESQDPVLKRLDDWYSDRIRRNYTSEVAREVRIQISQAMRKRKELSDLVSSELLETYSPANVLKISEKYWSKTYSGIEAFMDGASLEEINLNQLSKGVKEEYVAPSIEHFKKLKVFVDKLREQYKVKENLSDEDIDKKLINHFGSVENYAEFSRESFKALPFFMRAFNKGVPKEEFETQTKYCEAVSEVVPYLAGAIFSDLKSEGGN